MKKQFYTVEKHYKNGFITIYDTDTIKVTKLKLLYIKVSLLLKGVKKYYTFTKDDKQGL